MDFQPETSLPPPSQARISWLEKAYGVKLPPEYIELLKKGNGAVPKTNVFNQGERERLIERMLCILDNPSRDQVNGWLDIAVVLTQVDSRIIDDEDLIGMNVIPIANLFAGDLLCLDFRMNPKKPSVVVWDHELSEDFQPHLELVAHSFREFVNMLRVAVT